MSEDERKPVPMLCQHCNWHGNFAPEMMVGGHLTCPRCGSHEMAQVLGAPKHEDPEKHGPGI